MADFNAAYAITMKTEGGYANNPADNGGETYAGISRKFNPNWGGWAAIDAAKKQSGVLVTLDKILSNNEGLQADAKQFYAQNYWIVNRLGELQNQAIANQLFDIGVNSGVGTAARSWQEALNLTNQNGRAYADLVVDGKVGPQTVGFTNAHPRPALLLEVIQALQAERYLKIMRNNPSQEVFAASWFSRV